MSPILIILIILLIVGAGGGYYWGGDHGPYLGGGIGLVLLILIILALTGRKTNAKGAMDALSRLVRPRALTDSCA